MINVSAWPGIELIEEIAEGNRNRVWRARWRGDDVAVRQSRRAAASLAWELDVITFLDQHDFVVPAVVPAADGRRSVDGLVVQRWLAGREPTTDDWGAVAVELQRLHTLTSKYPQRPGSCAVAELAVQRRSGDADLDQMDDGAAATVTAVFAGYANQPTAVIHGDVHAPNIRIANGRVGLLDWDESRVDVPDHDLSPFEVPVLDVDRHHAAQRLSHAWEAVNGWVVEPDYARGRLAELRSA